MKIENTLKSEPIKQSNSVVAAPYLEMVNYSLFLKAIRQIKQSAITSRACLGYSSNDIYLYGFDRTSGISVRNHSGMYSMLITDSNRSFLFNGSFSMKLSDTLAASCLYTAFKLVKYKII